MFHGDLEDDRPDDSELEELMGDSSRFTAGTRIVDEDAMT